MFIAPVSNLSFNSNNRVVYKKDGKILYKNTTKFFRNDLNWKALSKFLSERYQSVEKVNVFNFACSDGSEPMSFAVALRENLGIEASKFFPIKASDVDREMIYKAKYEPCNISVNDLYRINDGTKCDYGKYFYAQCPSDHNFYMAVTPKAPINSAIDYECEDIIKGLDKMPEKNNVILARNFWCYLSDEARLALIAKLTEKLDRTSCLIIGALERGHGYDELLKKSGFYETGITNVFLKRV